VHALQEDSKPLPEALAAIASSFDARFTLRGTPTALPVESDQTLIRAMQEALTNAHRHAPGASLAAELDYDEAAQGTRPMVAVTIVNGTSTEDVREADEPEGTGMGLQGMRERAALLGGTVTAGPVDGRAEHGWVVTMRLPR
jgi:signal transduction histidine kinase